MGPVSNKFIWLAKGFLGLTDYYKLSTASRWPAGQRQVRIRQRLIKPSILFAAK